MVVSPLMLILLVMGVALCSAQETENTQQVFKIPLDSTGHTTLAWTLDYPSSTLTLEVHAPLHGKGWFALGFSDYGEMFPADYCVLWVDWKGVTRFEDAWAADDGRLWVDEHQDCGKIRVIRRPNGTKYVYTRSFDTCDERDYIIEEGTTHVVWLQGKGPLFSLDGLNVASATQNGLQRTQLLKNINPVAKHPPDTWAHEVLAQTVHVPSGDTTYWCHIHRLPEALNTKHHVVQFEAVIQPGNEALVHHMEVFHCEAPHDQVMPDYSGPCFDEARPEATQVCKRVLAAWAMGAPPFVYPKEAGLPIGGPEFNPYIMLEVHYNNPDLKPDWVDSSGVKLFVSASLRQFDGGVIELGLEYSDKMAIPPGQKEFTLTGYCITECTAVGIPQEGIVIFGSQLHTHLTGTQVMTRHVRDGEELPELNKDVHYSTHFQEIRSLKRRVKILPGDALITSCTFNTLARPNITLGGFAITDEMCVNYVHYYPKVELEVCKSSISHDSLHTYFGFMREWEGQTTTDDKGISAKYGSVEWTPIRARFLQEIYNVSPLSMQCNMSTGERFPGYWENRPLTPVRFPLPPPPRTACQKQE